MRAISFAAQRMSLLDPLLVYSSSKGLAITSKVLIMYEARTPVNAIKCTRRKCNEIQCLNQCYLVKYYHLFIYLCWTFRTILVYITVPWILKETTRNYIRENVKGKDQISIPPVFGYQTNLDYKVSSSSLKLRHGGCYIKSF